MTETESILGMDYVRACFELRADGLLYWKNRPREHFRDQRAFTKFSRMYAGKMAGRASKGYREVAIQYGERRLRLSAHRIIWMFHKGAWPEHSIDHINRDRGDNRIENLRDVPHEVNSRNNGNPNGSGLFGAHRKRGRFQAQIAIREGGKQRFLRLGIYATAEEASRVAIAARELRDAGRLS
jgi:hypothetical protein